MCVQFSANFVWFCSSFSVYLLPVFSLCKTDSVAGNFFTYLELLTNVEQAGEGSFHMNVWMFGSISCRNCLVCVSHTNRLASASGSQGPSMLSWHIAPSDPTRCDYRFMSFKITTLWMEWVQEIGWYWTFVVRAMNRFIVVTGEGNSTHTHTHTHVH